MANKSKKEPKPKRVPERFKMVTQGITIKRAPK